MRERLTAMGGNVVEGAIKNLHRVRYGLMLAAAISLCGSIPVRAANRLVESPNSLFNNTDQRTYTVTDSASDTNDEKISNEEGKLEVYYIDVGQGDASLIVCDGHSMLIDGGQGQQSDKIFSFLKEKGIEHLDFIVATHPDDDHIGGLSGALNYATVDKALSPVEMDDSEAFQNLLKYLERQNVSITVPEAGDTYKLGSADVSVLGPVTKTEQDNNNSLVLRLEYGAQSFLFTGDAEKEEEESILAMTMSGEIRSTVLKVGHHGSASSTTQEWLDAVEPSAAIISCGAGNEYGHPDREVLKRLEKEDVQVFRTDLQGDILVYSENGKLYCIVEKNPDADVFAAGDVPGETAAPLALEETDLQNDDTGIANDTGITRGGNADYVNGSNDAGNTSEEYEDSNEPVKNEIDYIVNTNTGKFHYPSCRSVKQMKDSNKRYVTFDRQELLDQGYESCGICHP